MAAKIKNYTSEVDADKSIAGIEKALAEFGATNVSKDYDAGECVRMSFTVIDPESGMPLDVVLEANADRVYEAMKGKRGLTDRQVAQLRRQSRRTAWRNLHELVQIQLTMLHLKQRSVMQSFLPDTVDAQTGQPVHVLISQTRKLLPAASDANVIDAG